MMIYFNYIKEKSTYNQSAFFLPFYAIPATGTLLNDTISTYTFLLFCVKNLKNARISFDVFRQIMTLYRKLSSY